LGEELIIFRDKSGRVGLLYPRCMHRGTSLYYGRVNERGIRCCYHGWLFDVEGNCLEQPCEPEGGLKREAARQPWYPVQERYGLVFAYMGPPKKMPLLPEIKELELAEGEYAHVVNDAGVHFEPNGSFPDGVPYNWLQIWENVMDPYHVHILHSTFTEVQFHDGFRNMPKVEFCRVGNGVTYHATFKLEDGRSVTRVSHAILPNMSSIPAVTLAPGNNRGFQWWVPFGDERFLLFNVLIDRDPQLKRIRIPVTPDGKTWDEMTEEERQDYPTDFEAQIGQGPINLHSDEHLVLSDVGVSTLRRLLTQQIEVVQQGGDPIGVAYSPRDATVEILSGNFFSDDPVGDSDAQSSVG
jgi:phenylpropionate dioxygenase-like ring-hydroxylating dioxygenase large terminal subunit